MPRSLQNKSLLGGAYIISGRRWREIIIIYSKWRKNTLSGSYLRTFSPVEMRAERKAHQAIDVRAHYRRAHIIIAAAQVLHAVKRAHRGRQVTLRLLQTLWCPYHVCIYTFHEQTTDSMCLCVINARAAVGNVRGSCPFLFMAFTTSHTEFPWCIEK